MHRHALGLTVASTAPLGQWGPRRPKPRAKCLLVDLDETLYATPALIKGVPDRIHRYMHERLGVPQEEVKDYNRFLYSTYGTSLAGLVAEGHSIDYDDWHANVHGTLPYEEHLQRDSRLRAVLDSIPHPKFIFTNSDRAHVERCLPLLGLEGCFAGVICFESTMAAAAKWRLGAAGIGGSPVICKPSRAALDIALRLAGGWMGGSVGGGGSSAAPDATVFFDDSVAAVAAAVRVGVYGVLVGQSTVPRRAGSEGEDRQVDMHVHTMHDLPHAMPWLWQEGGHGEHAGVHPAAAARRQHGAGELDGTAGRTLPVAA